MLKPAITNLILPQRQKPTIADISTRNWQKLVKFTFLMLMAFGVALIFTAEPAWGQESAQNASGFNPQIWLRNALQWIDGLGAVGALAFILLYIVATVAFLPGSILTLGAGVVFGVVMGSLYVFIGATIGATAAFLVGRYLARGWVAKKIAGNNKFRAIDEAVGREGLKIVLLTRLSPIFPFNLLNYAYGVTGVSLKDYFLGSVGMIPGTIMYVYIGSLAGNIATIGTEAQPDNPGVQWAIRIIGFIATVAVTVYVTKVARKALEDEVLESTDNDENQQINLN
ncbi:TVP38/TMEM64 family protein [Nodularia spumigena]|uniref:TVP38/TMEM64 family protein n=2 Tax=Cyanophyceae TaxID=3028117 RepID=UPI00232A8B15|nr:TVP38/TMEM64 family protein [Nodularia spumigena]MDB9358669.1 TVP38/TMEM64 family protein [Nodularia spumigena CS-587/03]MDB9306188.1 TVP38/TMEM64 family protein [Nodularia spumigena CS-591/12]MDB9317127.1 TVP38/TMEM64 family protein [Nodularia spumigena CS-590/01A]MDB9323848.1 TVP38/TMEM64 family protein [Nodularia spumigena CS-591/07A]MDB9331351.1 TVP38/TMEM64 family protein [Nodularia spumigena CS-591/04]